MTPDLRFFVLFACNLLLFYLLQLVNQTLGVHGATLFSDGLFLFFPALFLRLRWALLNIALFALWVDAALPLVFGFHLILWGCAGTVLFYLRQGLRRASRFQQVLACLAVTLVLVCVQGILLGGEFRMSPAYWERLLADLGLTLLLFFPLAYWFLSFEWVIMYLVGCDLRLDIQDDNR